jgi:hypothetical protein
MAAVGHHDDAVVDPVVANVVDGEPLLAGLLQPLELDVHGGPQSTVPSRHATLDLGGVLLKDHPAAFGCCVEFGDRCQAGSTHRDGCDRHEEGGDVAFRYPHDNPCQVRSCSPPPR